MRPGGHNRLAETASQHIGRSHPAHTVGKQFSQWRLVGPIVGIGGRQPPSVPGPTS